MFNGTQQSTVKILLGHPSLGPSIRTRTNQPWAQKHTHTHTRPNRKAGTCAQNPSSIFPRGTHNSNALTYSSSIFNFELSILRHSPHRPRTYCKNKPAASRVRHFRQQYRRTGQTLKNLPKNSKTKEAPRTMIKKSTKNNTKRNPQNNLKTIQNKTHKKILQIRPEKNPTKRPHTKIPQKHYETKTKKNNPKTDDFFLTKTNEPQTKGRTTYSTLLNCCVFVDIPIFTSAQIQACWRTGGRARGHCIRHRCSLLAWYYTPRTFIARCFCSTLPFARRYPSSTFQNKRQKKDKGRKKYFNHDTPKI